MPADDSNTLRVLVTGANSGLGFQTCCRTIDEFLVTRSPANALEIIITTRTASKGQDTLARLHKHLDTAYKHASKNAAAGSLPPREYISFRAENLDLCSLRSVQALATKLGQEKLKLDALVMNAGIGGWKSGLAGINWPIAVYLVMTDLLEAVTYPSSFKVTNIGLTAKPQTPGNDEPPLAEVFCANTFGHYLLGHYLAPLLSLSQHGRVVWLSSNEAYAHSLSLDDFQAFTSSEPYESSKRIADVLALSSRTEPVAPFENEWLSLQNQYATISPAEARSRPRIYLCHPGVCSTSIIDLPWILLRCMELSFWLARLCGSPWHVNRAYLGATATVWLILASQTTLDAVEAKEGRAKWGSACDRAGHERVDRTDVEGWGYSGRVEDAQVVLRRKGRRRGQKPVTDKDRQEFDALGVEVWRRMERLRIEWEARLESSK